MEQKRSTSYLLFQESPKISQHWREPKPKKNLTYHQYMPPEPRQGSRADPQAEGSALGPPGPPPWEWTNSQQPPPRYDPCFCSLGSSGPQLPPPPGRKSPNPRPLFLQFPEILTSSPRARATSSPPPPPASVPLLSGIGTSLLCSRGASELRSLAFLHLHEPLSLRTPECLFSLLLLTCFPFTTLARMKLSPLTPSPPGVPSPSPSPHKLELQTLKLEELTVSLGSSFPGWPSRSVGTQKSNLAASAPLEIQDLGSPVPPLSVSKCPAPTSPSPPPAPRSPPSTASFRLPP